MKKFISLVFVFVLFITCVLPALASYSSSYYTHPPLLVDDADIFTASEESSLLAKLEEISSRQKCDVVILTVYSLNGYGSAVFADNFYDKNDYGYGANNDGILFLYSTEYRDYQFSTTGFAYDAFTDAGLQALIDNIASDLKSGNYDKAFNSYAETCDDYINFYNSNGRGYDIDDLPKEPMPQESIILALVIGIAVAFAITGAMKGKLKSVKSESFASDYVKDGSFVMTENRDVFLTRRVSKTPIPKNTGSGSGGSRGGTTGRVSSSGTRHGGIGGRL